MSRLPLAALILVVLAIAGCGGDGNGEDTTDGMTSGQGRDTAVDEATAERVQELVPIARQSQYGKSRQESIKIATAQSELLQIAARDPEAIEPMLAPLERPDYDQIIGLLGFYIQLGKPGSEQVLIEALQRLEPSPANNPHVFEFLGSGNRKLVAAARGWASDHGFTISGTPSPVGGSWGSSGVYRPAAPSPGVQRAPAP